MTIIQSEFHYYGRIVLITFAIFPHLHQRLCSLMRMWYDAMMMCTMRYVLSWRTTRFMQVICRPMSLPQTRMLVSHSPGEIRCSLYIWWKVTLLTYKNDILEWNIIEYEKKNNTWHAKIKRWKQESIYTYIYKTGKKATTHGIPRRSPIQVLTMPDVA